MIEQRLCRLDIIDTYLSRIGMTRVEHAQTRFAMLAMADHLRLLAVPRICLFYALKDGL